jgi:hypothetical protein
MTRLALVFAGSRKFPMPKGRLKLKRFAHSIEPRIVLEAIAAIGTP